MRITLCLASLFTLSTSACDYSTGEVVFDDCTATPALDVPINQSQHGQPVHWQVEDCIPITFSESEVPMLPKIRKALLSWELASCDSICFGEPVASTSRERIFRAPDEEWNRIHFVSSSERDTPDDWPPISVVLSYRPQDARINEAHIGRTLSREPETSDYVRAIGFVLGLESPPFGSGVYSVLSSEPALEPTKADREALCTLYGAEPLCTSSL